MSVYLCLAMLPSIAVADPLGPNFCNMVEDDQTRAPSNPGHFLSDSEHAYGYIEGLQAMAWQKKPDYPHWTGSTEDREKLRKLLEDLDKRDPGDKATAGSYAATFDAMVKRLSRAMPTRYEDPNSIALMCTAGRLVEAEIVKDVPAFDLPYLGTLPTPTLNAMARSVPGETTEFVVVNSSLFLFAHELGKIGLATVDIEAQGDKIAIDTSDALFNRLRKDPDFLVRTSKFFEDYAKQRKIVAHARPRAFDDHLLNALDIGLEAFVIGHEFAHIVLHHTSRDRDAISGFGQQTSSSDATIRKLWGEEAVADLYSTAIVQRIALDKFRQSINGSIDDELGEFVRYAPVLFFQWSEQADVSRYVFEHGAAPPVPAEKDRSAILGFLSSALDAQMKTIDTTTMRPLPPREEESAPPIVRKIGDHPPTWARKMLVQDYWQSHAPAPKDEAEISLGAVAVAMGNHVESLWSDIQPLWIRIESNTLEK
ncbi:hypothetical protein GFM44_32735 [Rhizobium leguminosarum bv. viciae]|nr:hypothetical protein [Rhizobium leguminosarum bv. viciae]